MASPARNGTVRPRRHPAGYLDPYKAWILLHLRLAAGATREQVTAAFSAVGADPAAWPWQRPTRRLPTRPASLRRKCVDRRRGVCHDARYVDQPAQVRG